MALYKNLDLVVGGTDSERRGYYEAARLELQPLYPTGSLFNWRLKRRQRGASVLDKLDF